MNNFFNALGDLIIMNSSKEYINKIKLRDDFNNNNNMNDNICFIQCAECANNLHHAPLSASILLISNR